MKTPHLTSLLTAATLFLTLGAAGAQAQEAAPPPPPPPGDWHATMLKEFDKNGDGVLDATEKAAARAAMQQKMRERLESDPRFLARADTDHDGKISDAEWEAARARFKAMHGERMEHGPGFAGRHDERRDPAFRRGYLLGKYDKNGDGKLDETERAALRTDMEAKLRGRMERQLARLKAIDADGDGKISDAEWTAAKAKFKGMMHGQPHGHGPRGMGPEGAAPDGPPPPPAE